MKLDRDIVDAVFAAAITSRHWLTTSNGPRVEVSHDGAQYTVEIDGAGRYLAEITYCREYGGLTYIEGANATPEQHRALVEASRTAVPWN